MWQFFTERRLSYLCWQNPQPTDSKICVRAFLKTSLCCLAWFKSIFVSSTRCQWRPHSVATNKHITSISISSDNGNAYRLRLPSHITRLNVISRKKSRYSDSFAGNGVVGVRFPASTKDISLLYAVQTDRKKIQPISWVPGIFPLVLNRPGSKSDHSLFSAKVQNPCA